MTVHAPWRHAPSRATPPMRNLRTLVQQALPRCIVCLFLAGLGGSVAGGDAAAVETSAQIPVAKPAKEVVTVQCRGTTTKLWAEVARTPEQQARGLMYRTYLAPNHGMLFIHRPPRNVSMWMKNTPLSLDMVFISERGTIGHIVEHTKPYSLTPISSGGAAQAVLEVAAGTASRHRWTRGCTVTLPPQ